MYIDIAVACSGSVPVNLSIISLYRISYIAFMIFCNAVEISFLVTSKNIFGPWVYLSGT